MSRTATGTNTPYPTTISATRYWIDVFNLTFTIVSDRPYVSVGARDDYGDGIGNLVSTAVLIKTPANRIGDPNWAYRPTRVDLLMYGNPNQATRSINDFFVTLFSDDGSDVHNPSEQLSTPWPINAQSNPLLSYRAIWYQQDIRQAGWPIMPEKTYYWVVVTPGSPLTMPFPNTQYNGALWSGISQDQPKSMTDPSFLLPPIIRNDPYIFTGRELVSQRFASDSVFGANKQAAVDFLANPSNWAASINSSSPRFTNFYVSPPPPGSTPSRVRYGVQVLGWQVTPSNTPSPTRELEMSNMPCSIVHYFFESRCSEFVRNMR